MRLKGIDVSKHQGVIDWKKVKNDGVEFAIIRIGYGGSTPVKDERFEENYKNAKANGLKVGTYLYSYANSDSDVEAEVKAILKWLDGKTFDLPFYLDVEDNKTQGKLSVNELTNYVYNICERVENAGYFTGIYASKNWLETKLDMNKLNRFTVWLAQWSANPSYQGTYAMWQYTSDGSVNGISGRVDMNYQVAELGGNTGNVKEEQIEVDSDYTGNSIVDYLKSIGVDSSFENRKKLALANGFTSYTGTSKQNLKLLEILRNGGTTKTSTYNGNSIVDYLKSVGIDSSFENRKKLAEENGIKNYTGKANQNTKLLNILRGY